MIFLLDFILLHFFKETAKNVFFYGILFAFKKKMEREKDMILEKIQKNRKMLKKNVAIFSSNLNRIFGLENVEIWFSLFLEKL